MNHARVRYLEAKRTVDDRALNRSVSECLQEAVPPKPRVFEAGCGTGATVPRLLEWGVEPDSYLGVDSDETVLAHARDSRAMDLERGGHEVVDTPTGFEVDGSPFAFRRGDALGSAAAPAGSADLVVAAAFIDLVPLAEAVTAFERVLDDGGLAYFPITFDGGTVFQPAHPADEAVERAYHEYIDAQEGRDVRAGRHLAAHLLERDGDLLAMGASDWVVRPSNGGYPADEAHFLATVLGFVETALDDGAATRVDAIDDADVADWLATRRAQLADGELLYLAHQYDLLYRVPE